MASLVHVNYIILFGKDLGNIDKVIHNLDQRQLPLALESDIFYFMGIEIENQEKLGIFLRL